MCCFATTHFWESLLTGSPWEVQIWRHDWALLFVLTSNISSRDTSIRQWPAWGCCWDSSWRRILSFWTRSLLYLGTVRHSASSGSWPGDTRACWAWSFNWFWRLEGREMESGTGERGEWETGQDKETVRHGETRWKTKIVSLRCTNTKHKQTY